MEFRILPIDEALSFLKSQLVAYLPEDYKEGDDICDYIDDLTIDLDELFDGYREPTELEQALLGMAQLAKPTFKDTLT